MNTVVRCHVKNAERMVLLDKTLNSISLSGMHELGRLILVDDGSPLMDGVQQTATANKFEYVRATGKPDTKNGLVRSLELNDGKPVLCCVDDMVCGKGFLPAMKGILERDIPELEAANVPWGLIGTFACYNDRPRFRKSTLWNIPSTSLYALVCHVFSPRLAGILMDEWQRVENGSMEDPPACDDLWTARVCTREGILCFNTVQDYAQHTGAGARTFSDAQGSSYYLSQRFVGE